MQGSCGASLDRPDLASDGDHLPAHFLPFLGPLGGRVPELLLRLGPPGLHPLREHLLRLAALLRHALLEDFLGTSALSLYWKVILKSMERWKWKKFALKRILGKLSN